MSKHYQPIKSSHPSMGSAAESPSPRCCARCRRGTPATGLGECGYLGRCVCHQSVAERVNAEFMASIESDYQREANR